MVNPIGLTAGIKSLLDEAERLAQHVQQNPEAVWLGIFDPLRDATRLVAPISPEALVYSPLCFQVERIVAVVRRHLGEIFPGMRPVGRQLKELNKFRRQLVLFSTETTEKLSQRRQSQTAGGSGGGGESMAICPPAVAAAAMPANSAPLEEWLQWWIQQGNNGGQPPSPPAASPQQPQVDGQGPVLQERGTPFGGWMEVLAAEAGDGSGGSQEPQAAGYPPPPVQQAFTGLQIAMANFQQAIDAWAVQGGGGHA